MAEGWRKWDHNRQKALWMHIKGKNRHEIAEAIGLHPDRISDIIHSPKFMEEEAKVYESAAKRVSKLFEERAIKAAEKIIRLAEEGKPFERIQLDAAKEVLSQAGIKPVEVIEIRKREYTPAEIESALAVTKETEEIVKRLTKSKSPFLLQEVVDTTASVAPVPTSSEVEPEAEPEKVKVD